MEDQIVPQGEFVAITEKEDDQGKHYSILFEENSRTRRLEFRDYEPSSDSSMHFFSQGFLYSYPAIGYEHTIKETLRIGKVKTVSIEDFSKILEIIFNVVE